MIVESEQEAIDMLDYIVGWREGEGQGTENGKFEFNVCKSIFKKYPHLEGKYGWVSDWREREK